MPKTFKILLCFLFVINSFNYCYSQGAWNIKYVSSDSINNKFEGKEIRIDFKSSKNDTVNLMRFNVRHLLSKRDTVDIIVDNNSIKFVESWKLYVDHGVIDDQTLESLQDGIQKIKIEKMVLKKITDSTLTTEMMLHYPANKSNAKKEIVVLRKDVKGILIRRY